jgi:tetratricopeptide (TPR) repeat protein
VGGRAELCCELAKDFEDKGEYEEAREILIGLWPHMGQRPRLKGLDRSTSAELLLRAGVLTGWLGSRHQIADAHERSKNLITESLGIFESLSYRKKMAEAQTELALCYWRSGEVENARAVLNAALSHLTTDNDLRAKAVLRLAITEKRSDNQDKALRVLTKYATLFQKINNEMLKGCYHQTLGDVLENLWTARGPSEYLDRALVEYAAASYHFEQAGHRSYLANVENNLGFLLYKVNHCEEAHEHLDSARRIFNSLKDKSAAAQVDETRARVFLKEKRITEAEKIARASVRALEHSDRQSLLAEALTTHATALARLEQYGAALAAFRRALDLCEQIGNHNRAADIALTVFREMGDRLAVLDAAKPVSGRSLSEQIRALEHDVIKHALEACEGSITYAAQSLRLSYQNLNHMLKTRHRDLLQYRTPVRRRPRKTR